jgi:uncharacterized protein YacL
VFGAILGCLKFVEMIVGAINNETIILSGITGESFLASARSVTKVFRRNLISGVLEGTVDLKVGLLLTPIAHVVIHSFALI